MQDKIEEYLEELRKGNQDAYFSLLEAGADSLPLIIKAFYADDETRVKMLLLEIIWQKRRPECLPVLGDALSSDEDTLWKVALDGIVGLAHPAGLDVLRAERDRLFALTDQRDKRSRIEEAIQQMMRQQDD